MLRSIFQLKENREHRDLNPGLLGEKHERYLCAMLPLHYIIYKLSNFFQIQSRLEIYFLYKWHEGLVCTNRHQAVDNPKNLQMVSSFLSNLVLYYLQPVFDPSDSTGSVIATQELIQNLNAPNFGGN